MKNFLIALGFLTKIPIPKRLQADDKNLACSMAYFPIVGLLLGLILVFINLLLSPFLPVALVNLALILSSGLLTGAIHLDGFADTIDGFCAKTNDKEKILAIMRDSRIGAMGVTGLTLLLLFKYEALNNIPAQIKSPTLILMCALSRWSQVMAAHLSGYARSSEGLGRAFIGNIKRRVFWFAMACAFFISSLTLFWRGAVVFIIVYAAAWLLVKYARKRIGGMTGDTIGAISELIEVITLMGVYIMARVGQ